MATTRFSPFELLLLKSRNQTDTAALLLLTWVAASKGSLSETDRHHIAAMSASMRHGHDCQAIIDIGARQDLDAIQLAAEVLQKDRWGAQASPFLRQAIEVAVTEGTLAAATNHILRFLADLLGTAPQQFAQLYREVTGKPFESPDDPSRESYWQAREHARQQQRSQSEQRQRHSQQERSHGSSRQGHERPHGDKALRALDILGLDATATRGEIKKAYRRLAQSHHPDRFFALGERDVASASMRFQKIQKAYEYLMQDARFI